MRLIDADALSRIIKLAWDTSDSEDFEKSVFIAIETAPTIEPQQWTPVTERLPDDGAEVWVTTDMLFEVTRARWHKDTNLWYHPYNADCMLVLRPIAWMPMYVPEPWKGEEDEVN